MSTTPVKGIVKHQYVDASENLAQFAADQCNRQQVTAEFAYDHLVDRDFYMFKQINYENGLEPWVLVGGMDLLVEAVARPFVLEFGRSGEKVVSADHPVFVSRKILAELGFITEKPQSILKAKM